MIKIILMIISKIKDSLFIFIHTNDLLIDSTLLSIGIIHMDDVSKMKMKNCGDMKIG